MDRVIVILTLIFYWVIFEIVFGRLSKETPLMIKIIFCTINFIFVIMANLVSTWLCEFIEALKGVTF